MPKVDIPPSERIGKDYDISDRGRYKYFAGDMTGKEYLQQLPPHLQVNALGVNRVRLLQTGAKDFEDFYYKSGARVGELIPLKKLIPGSTLYDSTGKAIGVI